ncbi:MAG: alkaline phosphatase D family protein, partial [Acidobacteriota bacterium]|nr:alkaline phosphatase D family protein [Acidobacteriota bacterium]
MATTRRAFLGTAALAGAATFLDRLSPMMLAQTRQGRRVFLHGVASGDPLHQAVILWTRVTPPPGRREVAVTCEIARDARFTRIAGRTLQMASAARDFTVKVDAMGLEPGATYYYRFSALGEASQVGRTRTLPRETSRVRLAIASCSNLPFGYFNAYARIAARQDLDAVLHLGDYIYEYRNTEYGDGTAFGRIPMPDREITSLEDYRTRHAQYKSDPDLQEAHRLHPWIVVWDDHEFANNAWRHGAQNHNVDRDEGPWEARRDAAIQSYSEWMPIRDDRSSRETRIYRSFAFGKIADLVMLDTRFVGRDQEAPKREHIDILEDPKRTLLGSAQEQWLSNELRASKQAGVTWQLLGQQVMFAPMAPKGAPASNKDTWDGYRPARDRVLDALAANGIRNGVILTGDVHSSWAYDVSKDPWRDYDPVTGRGAAAVEIVTPAISSPGWGTREPEKAPALSRDYMAARPHLKWVEGVHRGYATLDITPARMQADWYFIPTVTERNATESFAKGFVSEAGA